MDDDAAFAAGGLLRRRDVPKRADVLIFSAACAAILHCYSDDRGRHRDVFRSKYLNILDFVFGGSGALITPAALSRCSRHPLIHPVVQPACRG